MISVQRWYPGQYLCDVCLRVISVHGLNLFQGCICSRAVFIQGWYLFKGSIYSRVVFIESSDYSREYLFKSETVQGRSLEVNTYIQWNSQEFCISKQEIKFHTKHRKFFYLCSREMFLLHLSNNTFCKVPKQQFFTVVCVFYAHKAPLYFMHTL